MRAWERGKGSQSTYLLNNNLRRKIVSPQPHPTQNRPSNQSPRRHQLLLLPLSPEPPEHRRTTRQTQRLPRDEPYARADRPDAGHHARRDPRRGELEGDGDGARDGDVDGIEAGGEEVRDHLPREGEDGEVEQGAGEGGEDGAVAEVGAKVVGGGVEEGGEGLEGAGAAVGGGGGGGGGLGLLEGGDDLVDLGWWWVSEGGGVVGMGEGLRGRWRSIRRGWRRGSCRG